MPPRQKLRVKPRSFLFVGGRALEDERSRYKSPTWRRAKERIGQLVRDNYRVDQEMSPRLAALVKKIENGSLELSTETFQAPGEKQGD